MWTTMVLLVKAVNKIAVLALLGLVLTAGCAANLTETRNGAPLARQVTASSHCGLTVPGLVYLSDRTDVQKLARVPGQTLTFGNLEQLDFSREHLVVVALGQKPTGGYGATLADSTIRSGDLVLTLTIQQPGKGTMVTQALTTPCTVVALTAGDGWRNLVVSGPEFGPITHKR